MIFEGADDEKCKKLVAFSRPVGSVFSEELFTFLDKIKEKKDSKITVFVPSSEEEVENLRALHDYTIIADPDGKIFSKYNCFTCNSGVQLVSGDKAFYEIADNSSNRPIFDEELLKLVFGMKENMKKRELQLPVFAELDENNRVTFAYYGKTATDFPKELAD